jgi:hypothetical protein
MFFARFYLICIFFASILSDVTYISVAVLHLLTCSSCIVPSTLGSLATIWPTVPATDGRCWSVWSNRWNENWQGKLKYSATNPIWSDLGWNPGRFYGKPATKNCGTAKKELTAYKSQRQKCTPIKVGYHRWPHHSWSYSQWKNAPCRNVHLCLRRTIWTVF